MTNVNHGSYCRCASCIDAENRVVATPAASTRTIDVLEAARKSGLRAHLHGLNATDARKLLSDFLVALNAPAAAPTTCRLADGRCGICGGDWSACGCEGMLRRSAARAPELATVETGEVAAR